MVDIKFKNTKYSVIFGLGHGITTGVSVLGTLMIGGFLLSQTNTDFFYRVFGFVPSRAITGLRVWQFVTAMFLHTGLPHLFLNLLGIYTLGVPVESRLGTKEFLKYFFLCGVGGFVLTYILWLSGFSRYDLTIGASGGIYGLLFAFSILFSTQKVVAFFVVPMQAKWLALLFAILEVLLSLRNDGINHIGHLGGLLAGFAYVCQIRSFEFVRRKILDFV